MVTTRYFAVRPTAALLNELTRVGLPVSVAKAELYSRESHDRVANASEQDLAKVKSVALRLFLEQLAHEVCNRPHTVGSELSNIFSATTFDRYWTVDVFPFCEDVDEIEFREGATP